MGKRIPFLIGLLILAISIWIQITQIDSVKQFLARLDNLAYDIQLRARILTNKTALNTSVAIVDIDDRSLVTEGRWPWSRAKLATLVEQLRTQGAVVIAFDTLLAEKEDNIAAQVINEIDLEKLNLANPNIDSVIKKIEPFFDDDAKLASSLKKIDTVLGISFLPTASTENNIPKPLAELDATKYSNLNIIDAAGVINNIPSLEIAARSSGFINVFADADGIIRRVPLILRYKNNIYPSLALEAVRLYLLTKVQLGTAHYGDSSQLEAVNIGDHHIPTDAAAQVIIPYRGKSFTFPYYSATDVLHQKIPRNALQGKIIFVGTSATGLGDLKATAVQSAYPGVEIHATIADGILQDTFSYKPAWGFGAEIFLTLVLGLIAVFWLPFLGPKLASIVMIVVPLLLFIINNIAWQKTGIIISILIPALLVIILAIVNIIYGYLFESRRRERLKEMFGQYVPEKHIDAMLQSSGNYGLLGEDREMTVMFADIRNFTTLSEPLDASQLKELLNEFFTPMTEIIFNTHGTIDKYVGDLIMAFWGAPLKDKKHATHGLHAALEMQIAVDKLKPVFAERGWPEVNIGIGLNSGLMSVGDMGSKFRRNYTVLGDAVNLASRVEGLSKFYGVKIVTTESTMKSAHSIVFRLLDRVRVKGKKLGVSIYEVVCLQEALNKELQSELDQWHQALDYYFNQDFKNAEKLITQLQQTKPDTKLYSLYLSRIAEFKENPPPADWDGIYVHTAK